MLVELFPRAHARYASLPVTDVLDAAENREDLTAGSTVLETELAGKALPVAEAPVGSRHQRRQTMFHGGENDANAFQ